jgi:hypothetical protein
MDQVRTIFFFFVLGAWVRFEGRLKFFPFHMFLLFLCGHTCEVCLLHSVRPYLSGTWVYDFLMLLQNFELWFRNSYSEHTGCRYYDYDLRGLFRGAINAVQSFALIGRMSQFW